MYLRYGIMNMIEAVEASWKPMKYALLTIVGAYGVWMLVSIIVLAPIRADMRQREYAYENKITSLLKGRENDRTGYNSPTTKMVGRQQIKGIKGKDARVPARVDRQKLHGAHAAIAAGRIEDRP